MIFINPSNKPLYLSQEEVLETFESLESNTLYIYFNKE